MSIDPQFAPHSGRDLGPWKRWVEERLKYLASGRNIIERGSVAGGVTTIHEILTAPAVGGQFKRDWTTVTTTGGPTTLVLSYLPRTDSLHLYLAGVEQREGTDWTRDGLILTFTDVHQKAGQHLEARYYYETFADGVDPVVITSPSAGSTTGDTTPTITGTAAAGRPVHVYVDGVLVGTTTSATDSTWTVTVASPLSFGGHTISASATNPDTSLAWAVPVAFSVVTPSPATATLRGTHTDSGDNFPNLPSIPLPAGTVIGDLIVVAFATANVDLTNSDSRLTRLGENMLIGFATSLGDLNVTIPGGFGSHWSIVCATWNTNATGWTAQTETGNGSLNSPDTLALGTIASIGFTVAAISSWHNFVSGNCTNPTGYTEADSATPSIVHARLAYWTSGALATSPSGPTNFLGGPGGANTTVVGLIGP